MRRTEITTWDNARNGVIKTNKQLAKIIDKLSPSQSFKLIKAKYFFGDLIIDNGQTNLPSNNTDNLTSAENFLETYNLLNSFSYSPILLGLILNKGCEVFVNANERAIPLNLLTSGDIFGTFEAMNFLTKTPINPIWSVSAGARTIFSLPKLSDNNGIKRLRMHFKFPTALRAKSLWDHWNLFKNIGISQEKKWNMEILFFSKDWLNRKNDPAWFDFYNYIFKMTWKQVQYALEKISFSLNWQNFIDAVSKRHLKPRPYLADTVKHLFLISSKAAPGIVTNDGSEQLAPISAIKNALLKIYQLKSYTPTIMHVGNQKSNIKSPLYYSLSYPTLLEGHPYDKTSSTIMLDLRDIKQLIDTLEISAITSRDYFAPNTKFDYFHVDNDMYGDILPSRLLPQADKLLDINNGENNREFCYSSAFWRGCIRIAHKKN